ncbi:DUF421 domain-containing protein [Amphibacillus cookii]|uniref:DUF421 domain-containing protein n=1 Tax=Amphibacillus cookii TaxID=767787 RepID=UPI00195C8969|nr:DUF421 domain-containing protein [Amphibacillus cookii]MBM7541043.1 uncharacterized membrane protein YcaP (DUF421 family) [Amphibacillus cookii]
MTVISDIGLVIGRILTIIPLLLAVVLFMGKRAIGQLPVFDFIIIIVLGSIVGADIADPDIDHLPTAVAVLAIAGFQRLIANRKLANRKLNQMLTFEPTVIIHEGKFIYAHVKSIKYTIDNILQMLREKDIFDIGEVETAIIEPNGNLSVLKKGGGQASEAYPIIMDGVIERDILKFVKVDEKWLLDQLTKLGITELKSVFFASININHDLQISLKNQGQPQVPPIKY